MPFQAWIPDTEDPGVDVFNLASMGPCPFRHGYRIWSATLSFTERSFNGAMPFQAWIHFNALQGTSFDEGFNGAMPFQAWILIAKGRWLTWPTTLQWGHALSGMDTWSRISMLEQMVMLQWGHALSGMDTSH